MQCDGDAVQRSGTGRVIHKSVVGQLVDDVVLLGDDLFGERL